MIGNILFLFFKATWYGFIAMVILCFLYGLLVEGKILGLKKTDNNKDNIKRTKVYITTAFVVIIIFIYLMIKAYWGNNTIDSFLSENDFTAQYYVNVFPNENSSKNYRLKADISVWDEDGFGQIIKINKVYWPNGGYLLFDKYDYEDKNFADNKCNTIQDNDGTEWKIELTDNKIK